MNPQFSHLLRSVGTLLLSVGWALASATTVAAEDLPKEIAARLAPQWLADAEQIRTPEHVIYYRGSAVGSLAPDSKHWAGVIEGEVLVLTPTMAAACPKVLLGPTGSISLVGKSQSKLVEDAPWKKLLESRK